MIGVLAAIVLFYIYYYTRYLAGVQRRVRHQLHHRFRWKETEPTSLNLSEPFSTSLHGFAYRPSLPRENPSQPQPQAATPGVSVVVCARNESYNLRHYLHALAGQRYPEFEVIVVNDGSQDDTQTVLDHYSKLFRNLRLTFVPGDAWVRSSKKLALTLAAKAAKYDYLLLTDADCRPESPNWISEMMQGFRNPDTEVVIGYGGYFDEPTAINRLVRYDTVMNAMTYLGFAMSRHPYMGVGRNLAYRKDTFFRHHGFAGTLGQRAGDDDLFVNKIATSLNTEVVITPDSFTWSIPKHTYAEWRMQRYRHLSVSPSYRLSTKLRLTAEPVIRALLYLLVIAAIVLAALGIAGPVNPAEPIGTQLLSNPLWVIAMASLCVYLFRLVWLTLLVNRAARIFRTHTFSAFHVLAYDIFLPLFNLAMLIRHAFRRKREQQW